MDPDVPRHTSGWRASHERGRACGPATRGATGIVVAALIGFLPAVAAAGDIPLPRPKPDREAGAQASLAAISKFVEGTGGGEGFPESGIFESPVARYAPPASFGTGRPGDAEVQLYLVAKLTADGRPLDSGVHWRVFGELPDKGGKLPLLYSDSGGDTEVRLKPGRYLAHASFGAASASQVVTLGARPSSETLVLDAGGVRLDAVLGEDEAPLAGALEFEILTPDNTTEGGMRLVAEAKPGKIVPLPAGPYKVVSRYGRLNAVRSADLVVEPGKLTNLTLRHGAAGVTLKLVAEGGGEALADTTWTVAEKGEDGTSEGTIFQGVGAFPSIILAEGDYLVEAKHRGATYRREFTVEAGLDRDIEVLAE